MDRKIHVGSITLIYSNSDPSSNYSNRGHLVKNLFSRKSQKIGRKFNSGQGIFDDKIFGAVYQGFCMNFPTDILNCSTY